MELEKFLTSNGLHEIPIAMTGCRAHGNPFDSCDYDIAVFDESQQNCQVLPYEGQFVNVHHHSINETRTSKLIHLYGMQIMSDGSLELGGFLTRLEERRSKIFKDHARNCLIESMFCCQKCITGLQDSDVFSACWQKCASYLLADAVFALNQKPPSPSHMLETTRKLWKNDTNEKMSQITQTLGIERATPSLLERMLKSTIGFSDVTKNGEHTQAIKNKHNNFVKNAMLSDCYFYLGYINKTNFLKIRYSISANPDLIHMLKVAFDLEADPTTTLRHAHVIQDMSQDILHSTSE